MNVDAVSLRLANRRDADAIHEMILALARETVDADKVTSGPSDILRHGFGTEPLFEAMIAERGGRPVGLCLFFYTFSTWLGEPGVFVQDLYVAVDERGRGLGRRLLASVARYGRERRATHLRLTVESRNRAAKDFYLRIGMEHRDNEDTYHVGGEAFLNLSAGAS